MARKAKIKPRAASREREAPEARVKRSTTVTFTGEDLTVLARMLAAGQVMLPTSHPVFWRLKAAMTRLGLPTPMGL